MTLKTAVKLKLISILIIFLTSIPGLVRAQIELDAEGEKERRHSVSFLISHSHVSQGVKDNESKWLILPSFGFDYNFKLSPMWSIGLHNDLIIESFKILKSDGETELERTRPFVSILTAGFKPGKHFTYQLGFGGEFEKEENFYVGRIGVEYGWELSERTEIFSNLVYDLKWKSYNSYVIGLGLTRKL